uniref:N-acetyltransferase domain-containing protein n=1 Tax=Timema shepardi TaxID=629360 RepID=A0A7R9AUS5_TIMSH|nr:unnamed protein product [Timema shepardi]
MTLPSSARPGYPALLFNLPKSSKFYGVACLLMSLIRQDEVSPSDWRPAKPLVGSGFWINLEAGLGAGSNLVLKAIRAMVADKADEVVLETEITNRPALRLYENLGFVRDKRLFRYYLNGVDALRLKLWLR